MYSCGSLFDGKSPSMQELPTLAVIQSSMQIPDISVVDSSHNSASTQKSTRKNQRKFDKKFRFLSHTHQGVPCLVTGNKALEARSDIAFTSSNFKVAVDDTG